MENILSYDTNTLIRDLFGIMSEVLANRDYPTYEHTIRVAKIAKYLGQAFSLPGEEIEILELAGLVHDIGKTAIPDDILLKPDLFNDQDRRIMEFHPLIGAKFFAPRLQDDRITNIVLRHHERLDGSGYPYGLVDDEICLLTRITAVADVFEALTAKRPYKKALSPANAIKILEHEAAHHRLDEEVVEVLKTIDNDLVMGEVPLYPTAGFMEEIEHFRRDTFFRDTLSELFNYRYLLVLDDMNFLGEGPEKGYELMLINFHNFNHFQAEIGFIIANQVHDEIGQNLREMVIGSQERRQQYEGSIMLFRKNCDYMIYAECDSEEVLTPFIQQIRSQLETSNEEWGLEAQCFRLWFNRDTAMEEAFTRVFNLEAGEIESCKR